MLPAQQVFAKEFDARFFNLPANVQRQIERRIDLLGVQLKTFHHRRFQGIPAFKLRVGDYRVIYSFDAAANVVHLITVGHRREVYRGL